MKNIIKLFDPHYGKAEERAILKVLKSGYWTSGSGVGNVEYFENDVKKYVKSKDCIAVNSGTAALNLALSLIDIKNKEVILPSLTFVSTAHAVIINGGIPKFVDIDSKSLCIDTDKIEDLITKKTRVILPVHFGGMACNLDKIISLSKKFKLTVIEDAAHAIGTTYKNKKIGTHGTAVCFSFHPVKNLAMPTGGLISINDKAHERFRKILLARRWCGITNRNNYTYDIEGLGWNYYMDNFTAAIGQIQLKNLDKMLKIKKRIAKKYSNQINLDTKMEYDDSCSYHLYWICVKNRNKFMKKMLNAGIETGIHYKPIHQMHMYSNRDYTDQKLETTDNISKEIVSIPVHQNLSDTDTDRIIKTINEFC